MLNILIDTGTGGSYKYIFSFVATKTNMKQQLNLIQLCFLFM